jgi:hypothetical protein
MLLDTPLYVYDRDASTGMKGREDAPDARELKVEVMEA